jgi:hypothetical protein
MVSSLREVIETSDVVVVSKNNRRIHDAIVKHGDSRVIIDLVRLYPESISWPAYYEGICW